MTPFIPSLNFRGNCVLDVILSEDAVYVMDVLFFNNVDYSESEAESRMFTVSSRVASVRSHSRPAIGRRLHRPPRQQAAAGKARSLAAVFALLAAATLRR